MIKIQNGDMIVTCDSVAEAAEFIRLQSRYKVNNEVNIGIPKNVISKKKIKKNLKHNPWTKSEIEVLLNSIQQGVTGLKTSQNEFLTERHTRDGIQFLYFKLKKGASVSKKVTKMVNEIKQSTSSPHRSILDANIPPKTREYLILDK